MLRSVCYAVLVSSLVGGATNLHAQLIAAHRGASQDAPENSSASFMLAWEQDADAIETDFHLTSDQQIVCIHDPTTERVCGKDKNLTVAQATLAELQALDIGSWKDPRFYDQRMPSLAEVLALVPNDKGIYLEIKCGPEIVPSMQRALSDSPLLPRQTIIISFKADVIQAVKRAMPERQAYWLVDFHKDEHSGKWSPTVEDLIADAKKINADGVDLNGITEVVDARLIERCRQAGLSVHVWTIDDPEKALLYQRLGVDSITTNRPGELREILLAAKPSAAVPTSSSPVARVPAVSGTKPSSQPVTVP